MNQRTISSGRESFMEKASDWVVVDVDPEPKAETAEGN